MITPIRPEDQIIGGVPVGIGADLEESSLALKNLALIEAVRQTFERDAEWLAAVDGANARHAEWEAFEGYGDAGNFLGGNGKLRAPMPRRRPVVDAIVGPRRPSVFWEPGSPPCPADPDTEIDRLARLIVDGEYRRRATQKEGEQE